MLRNIVAAVAGVVAGAVIIFLVEGAGHLLFPPPPGLNLADPQALKEAMPLIPIGAKVSILIAWFLGILGGGVVASILSRQWAPAGIVVAATLGMLALITMVQIPHPLWMWIGAAAATILGAVMALKLTGARFERPAPPHDPMPKM